MKNIFKKKSHIVLSLHHLSIKILVMGLLIVACISNALQAQDDNYTQPAWWFGVAGGANFNFYRGTTQELNSDLIVPAAFRHGTGTGLYIAPEVEYHAPGSIWGGMLQVGYDNRSGKFNEVLTPCNCPADLSTSLSYLTVEPSVRIAPFKNNFYVYGGPRLAFNLNKSFKYNLGINPDVPGQLPTPEVKGDFNEMNKVALSLQIGAGYDIPVTKQGRQNQFVISPFVNFQPYFGQYPRKIETWNVTSLRVGIALKFGRGQKNAGQLTSVVPVIESAIRFTVNSPENIPTERRVRETFPIRNYVFFDLGSTEIPDRYVMLTKDQVKDFKEDQLEVFKPKRLSGRSEREMIVYYNLLNILGDRMNKNASTTINLVGSSEKGIDDAKAMAVTVKTYLVNVFGINGSRISTEGRIKPKIASEQPGGTLELDLLREGDHRVSIESSSPILLLEFQSGPNTPLKSVEFMAAQEAPVNSYVTFNVEGMNDDFYSWTLEIRNEKGELQKFGPFTTSTVSIPGKKILGVNPQGDYKVIMIGQTKSGKIIKRDASLHVVLWKQSQREEGLRYSVIFEFNESKTIDIYKKYLTDIVTPRIPAGGTVIIHGHTDKIGDSNFNLQLSVDRATEIKNIIEAALTKAVRTDVKFVVHGYGEDEKLAPFENKLPEERFYNRTVIIDIIPKD